MESYTHAAEPTSDYVVVLAAPDEASLEALELRLIASGTAYAAFREPDLDLSLTAIGLAPVEDRRSVQRLLKGFPLLGDNP